MAVSAAVEIDRNRVVELIKRESAALDERTQASNENMSRGESHDHHTERNR